MNKMILLKARFDDFNKEIEEVRATIQNHIANRRCELNTTFEKEVPDHIKIVHLIDRQPTVSWEETLKSLLEEQLTKLRLI